MTSALRGFWVAHEARVERKISHSLSFRNKVILSRQRVSESFLTSTMIYPPNDDCFTFYRFDCLFVVDCLVFVNLERDTELSFL